MKAETIISLGHSLISVEEVSLEPKRVVESLVLEINATEVLGYMGGLIDAGDA